MSTRRRTCARRLALTAALCALAALAGRGEAALAALPSCATSGLVAWIETPGSGAAGSVYYQLELTNLSGHACTLAGYPGVSGVDLRGRRVGVPAGRDAAHAPGAVRLASGASATAILQITDVYNFPPASCDRVLAAGLRVYPPGQTASELVPYPFEACARRGPVFLHVEAVQSGLPPIR